MGDCRVLGFQAEGGSAEEADVDAGLRGAVLSRVREVVAEREAVLKRQMSSREMELQVRQKPKKTIGYIWDWSQAWDEVISQDNLLPLKDG